MRDVLGQSCGTHGLAMMSEFLHLNTSVAVSNSNRAF